MWRVVLTGSWLASGQPWWLPWPQQSYPGQRWAAGHGKWPWLTWRGSRWLTGAWDGELDMEKTYQWWQLHLLELSYICLLHISSLLFCIHSSPQKIFILFIQSDIRDKNQIEIQKRGVDSSSRTFIHSLFTFNILIILFLANMRHDIHHIFIK